MIVILLFIYPALLLGTVLIILFSWRKSALSNYISDPKSAWFTILGILFTVISPLIGFARYDEFKPEIPFSPEHVPAVELMVAVSALSYWVSRFYKRELPYVLNLFVRAGMLQGILLCILLTIHFGPEYLINGLAWPTIGFELDAPPIAGLFILYEFVCNIRLSDSTAAKKDFAWWRGMQWGLPVVLFVVEQALLLPFGLQWNSWLLAFTHSHDFTFSIS